MIGQFVVVRTYSAGVHCGVLQSKNGKEVVLSDARRIWNWNGANTLNEVATKGVAENSRISQPVDAIELTEAIELIQASAAARENLTQSRWGK